MVPAGARGQKQPGIWEGPTVSNKNNLYLAAKTWDLIIVQWTRRN